ncbi:hypothetical protein [Roseococcus sp. YIM B11640]|uniref:hypothetical protein n=1 Tax=Roseococcus sp. YIM B11640 TaxID=3133973 RepID=UPI003C7CF91E
MKKRFLLTLLAGAGLLAGCTPQQQQYGGPVTGGPGCDTRFRVTNNSSQIVRELYFSHSSTNSWGRDQLGQNVLYPGRYVNYVAANPGGYDFKVVWNDGRQAEIRRVNVCAASQIAVTNAGLFAR